ncbi:hypothetical protein HFN76_34770 [Rhizobium laguerreae]|uniref:hypothetical protein n=1 Tax=Rhizobium laguerreae TaxID=1076926 RepID=UPI001C907950|nr:hypothetical protein [Rhizobium laguerreae]MBY3517268.1 hypothetical protein [Rhizobium laguerreae]
MAHVSAVDRKDTTGPAIVALQRSFRAWTARALNLADVRPAGGDKLLQAFFRPVTKDRLAVALWLDDSDKGYCSRRPYIGFLVSALIGHRHQLCFAINFRTQNSEFL